MEKGGIDKPLRLYESRVPQEWIYYNDHMTEASYLTAFGDASDALFRHVGIDEAYRAAGHSFYTVETHINYYREATLGEPLQITTQLLGLDKKRLHIFHHMLHGDTGVLLATTEQMLVHVDMGAGAAAAILPGLYDRLSAIMAAHSDMDRPPQVGRQMSIGPKPGG